MTKGRRGRPLGTSPHKQSDDPLLRTAAYRILTGQASSPTDAFRQLTGSDDGPVIRRLQRRWQREGQSFITAHIEGLQDQRRAWEERSLEKSAPGLYLQLKQFMESPGGIELLAPGAMQRSFDFMTIWRLREQHVPAGAARAEAEFARSSRQWAHYGSGPDQAFLRRFAELCLAEADALDVDPEPADLAAATTGETPAEDQS